MPALMFCIFLAPGCGGGGSDDDDDPSSTEETGGNTPQNNTGGDDTTDDGYEYASYGEYDIPSVTTFSDSAYDLADATTITLNKTSITVTGTGKDNVAVTGTTATITASGTYNITGTLTDGQLMVDVPDTDADAGDVRLYLNGINITSSDASPVDIESAERVIVVLAAGTGNYLTDGATNTSLDEDDEEIDAAFFSKDDLVIYGTGSLTVKANYKDGIKCKDGLIIDGGTYNVTAADDGIIGKNYVSVEAGTITIGAGGDGIKSTNENTDEQGYVVVGGGIINITAGADDDAGDAIQAETHIVVTGGAFDITVFGGSQHYADMDTNNDNEADLTAKGFKANVGITINGGYFTADSADDAFHSDDTIVINGGVFDVASGDDAVHADLEISIDGAATDIDVSTCYEGIEAATITIDNGDIHIISSDDGINVAGGVDGSGMIGGRGMVPGDDFSTPDSGYLLTINGGYIFVNTGSYLDTDGDGDSDSGGDGIDINGSVVMTGGTLIVYSGYDSYDDNGALDYDGSFTISGGIVIAAGYSAMAQPPGGQTSSQYSLLLNLGSTRQDAGTLFHIETEGGTELVTFAPENDYNSIGFSSPALATGNYVYSLGGASTGTETDGVYDGGTYSGGTDESLTISSIVTSIR